MTLNAWTIALPVVLLALGLTGVVGAQFAVFGVVLAIFFGTLSLGRARPGDATQTHPGT